MSTSRKLVESLVEGASELTAVPAEAQCDDCSHEFTVRGDETY